MVGIDVVRIDRFRKVSVDDLVYWQKFFTMEEIQYSLIKPDFHAHLAGILAAKEAVMKAIGTELVGRFDLIHITHTATGAPKATVQNWLQEVAISISHDGEYA